MSDLPTGWDEVPLNEAVTFIRGLTFKPDDVVDPGPNTVDVFRTKNIQETLLRDDVLALPADTLKRPDQLLSEGDVLMSTANSWNLVGKCSWVPELQRRSSFGGFVTALRADSDRVFPRYLYFWLSSPRTQARLRQLANKTTSISNLKPGRVGTLKLPLPPLPEQRRIAAILDSASELVSRVEEAQRRTTDLKRSTYIAMFGSGDSTWPNTTVADVALPQKNAIRTGPFGSQLLKEEFQDEGVPVLGIDNAVHNEFRWGERRYISPDKYEQLKRYTVHPLSLIHI